jgi:hypothetical protein
MLQICNMSIFVKINIGECGKNSLIEGDIEVIIPSSLEGGVCNGVLCQTLGIVYEQVLQSCNGR